MEQEKSKDKLRDVTEKLMSLEDKLKEHIKSKEDEK